MDGRTYLDKYVYVHISTHVPNYVHLYVPTCLREFDFMRRIAATKHAQQTLKTSTRARALNHFARTEAKLDADTKT